MIGQFTTKELVIGCCSLIGSIVLVLVVVGGIAALCNPSYPSDGWTSAAFHWKGLDIQAKSMRANGMWDISPSISYSSIYPDPRVTPGAIFKEADLEKIKQSNYSKSVRDVPESLKRKIIERYGEPSDVGEIDHLVPLSIGGSNAIENLWPQQSKGEWNYKVKDRLEKRVLADGRNGTLDLHETQEAIASDWIALYEKLFPGESPKEAMIAPEEQ